MKNIFQQLLFMAILFGIPAFARSGATTNHVVLTLDLLDGSKVVGVCGNDVFKFQSSILGGFKLAPEQITSVEFKSGTNLVKVATALGDTLLAVIVSGDIKVETGFGKIAVSTDSIRRMQLARRATGTDAASALVARWSAEENCEDGVGGSPAQPVGLLRYSIGKVGQSFSFNGRNAYLLVHSGETLDVGKTSGLTFEFWAKPSTVNAEMMLIEYERELGTADGSDVGVNFEIQPVGMGGVLYANLTDTEGVNHVITTPPQALERGQWQHIALTYNRDTGEAGIYVDGAVAAQKNLGKFTPQTGFPNLLIGARTTFHSPMQPGVMFSGNMDELGIYNRALTPDEVKTIYEAAGSGASGR